MTISFQFLAFRAWRASAAIFIFSATDKSSEIVLLVLAGSTIRASGNLSRRYSKTLHTLPPRVSALREVRDDKAGVTRSCARHK
jgi:hypothetical protein